MEKFFLKEKLERIAKSVRTFGKEHFTFSTLFNPHEGSDEMCPLHVPSLAERGP
jgi:hypothetical protein